MLIDEMLEGLNEGQKKAVYHIDGTALVIATAGSGKTRVIVIRTQYMILKGIAPSSILLTTFTNKAANEMKSRIVSVVGDAGKEVNVGTFHSVCNRILRKYANKIGFDRNFTILDESEVKKIQKKIAKKYDLNENTLGSYISNCKSKCMTPTMAIKDANTDVKNNLAECYRLYQEQLSLQMSMDFDDLLLNTVILLENNSDVLKAVNEKWQYISADENQDSSDLDSRLIYLLAGKKQNIFFVGDDEQSIYGFRGSNVDNILNLKNLYKNLTVYDLGVNYRSTKTIIEAGKSVIRNNKNQMKKNVNCGRKNKGGEEVVGPPIIQTKCKSQQDEAIKIMAYIKKLHSDNIPLREIAVLYRMSYLSRPVEEILMKNKIKYELIGGTPFFCRIEVQDILAYARLTINHYDIQAFKRTIGIPKRGIGEKTIEKIELFCLESLENPVSIREGLNTIKLKGKSGNGIDEYNLLLKDLDSKKDSLSNKDFLRYIIDETNYVEYLKSNYDKDYEERIENLEELLSIANDYENIEELLVQASLYREDIKTDEDAVQLMTMHKSKGLEFEAVIMTNMCEGTIPHYKSLNNEKQLEEERRLAFVGITRAKNFLFMTYPQFQKINGSLSYASPSRFLNEINPKLVYKN